MVRATPVERYTDRFKGESVGPRVTMEWLENISLSTYQAEVDERSDTPYTTPQAESCQGKALLESRHV